MTPIRLLLKEPRNQTELWTKESAGKRLKEKRNGKRKLRIKESED